MKTTFDNGTITTNKWELDNISISHNIVDYKKFSSQVFRNESDSVRLHFGLKGDYNFHYKQLHSSFELKGEHNNIIYSNGLDMEVSNKSKQIETFGVNFTTASFIDFAQNGNDALKKLAERVNKKENAILSNNWRPNNFKIQQVINEIIQCQFTDELRNLFLTF